LLRFHGQHDRFLGAASVGHKRIGSTHRADLAHKLGDCVDGRANDHQVCVGDALGNVGRESVDDAELLGFGEIGLISTDPNDLAGKLPLAQCQSNRSTDQPDADNRHPLKICHAGILSGKEPHGEGRPAMSPAGLDSGLECDHESFGQKPFPWGTVCGLQPKNESRRSWRLNCHRRIQLSGNRAIRSVLAVVPVGHRQRSHHGCRSLRNRTSLIETPAATNVLARLPKK
jgi:hypothetical protein